MWQQYSDQQGYNGNNNMMSYDSSLQLNVSNTNGVKVEDFSLGDYGFEAGDFDVIDYSQQGEMHNASNDSYMFDSMSANDSSSINNGSGLRDWHSEEDLPKRMEMTHRIMQLLQERKKEPCQKSWLQELPHKALKLEKQLYKAAPSLEAYMDESSLKHRLRKVANAITTHVRLKKANEMQRELASSLPPNWKSSNVQHVDYITDSPPVSQVITTPNADSSSVSSSPNGGIDQTQLLSQMLEMQKTLNNLMKISSMNGTDISNEQQQLQQQMFEMQNQLNQLNQQSMTPMLFSSMNGNFSSNSIPTTFNNMPSFNNSTNLRNSIQFPTNSAPLNQNMVTFDTTESNDEELDMDFLQETFGANKQFAV